MIEIEIGRSAMDKSNCTTVRIHQLVSAFFERAQLLKEQIQQPLSPSPTESTESGPYYLKK